MQTPFSHRLFAALSLVCLAATPPTSAQGQGSDAGAHVERLSSNAFAIIHADAIHDFPAGTTDWPHSNVGVVVGNRCTLVVDSDFFPSRARDDIALIERLTTRPVCYLVNTHWHGDHTHGNGVYRKRFPTLQIIGTEETRDFIAINQARYPTRVLSKDSEVRRQLSRLQTMLAAGKDSAGRLLGDSSRALLQRVISEYETQLREFALITVTPPDRLFADSLTLDLGGISVRIRSRGRANSPDDLTIEVPSQGILFTGDIVVYPVPYAFGVHPTRWTKVLRDIEREKPSVIVPGHGPVMHDLTYVTRVRTLLDTVLARVKQLARDGHSAPEVRRLIRLDDLRATWVKAGDKNAAAYWDSSIRDALLESTFQCVIGSRC